MLKNRRFSKQIFRLVDANSNRLREGLRVQEDILRFIANEALLTSQYKSFRHELARYLKPYGYLIEERAIESDVGKKTIKSELKRNNILEIFMANAQRTKESLRVLEEFFKIIDVETSLKIKKLRYKLYDLEKKSYKRIFNLLNS